jgi:hypothetical protein
MSRRDKVTEIMTLAGVLPRDFDHARKNFPPLEDKEVDARLTRLREGETTIQRWRAGIGVKIVSPA